VTKHTWTFVSQNDRVYKSKQAHAVPATQNTMLVCNMYDIFSILHVCTHFVLTYLAWSRCHTLQSIYAGVYCGTLCYYAFSCACVAHNSMHCKTFHSRKIEKIYQHMLTLSFGHPVLTLVPGHNLSHHRHTESSRDPMRTSKMQYKWHFLNLLLFQPTVAWDVFRMDMRYMSMQRIMNTSYFWDTSLQWGTLLFSQIVLFCMHPPKFLLYVYLPHLFAQWAIVTMNILQHDGCSTVCHTRGAEANANTHANRYNTARNFTGVVLNLMTFNNGFHTVHHMYPSMHWSRLREQHNLCIKPHIHPALEQSSLCTYIFRTFVFPGKRVDYLGCPIVFTKEQPGLDQDWTIEHAPDGMTLCDYDIDLGIRSLVSGLGKKRYNTNAIIPYSATKRDTHAI